MLRTRAECIKEYGSDYYINRLIVEGKLFRIEKDIFSEKIRNYAEAVPKSDKVIRTLCTEVY